MGPLLLDQYQQFKCCASRATVSHPAVPLWLSDVRFVACCHKTSRDALSTTRRKTESHQEQILAQVSLTAWYLVMERPWVWVELLGVLINRYLPGCFSRLRCCRWLAWMFLRRLCLCEMSPPPKIKSCLGENIGTLSLKPVHMYIVNMFNIYIRSLVRLLYWIILEINL